MMTREQFEAHVRAEAAARYERTPYNSASVKRNAYIAARMEHEWRLVEALQKTRNRLPDSPGNGGMGTAEDHARSDAQTFDFDTRSIIDAALPPLRHQTQAAMSEELPFGAEFSFDRKYRYALWRIWDASKPLVMFIGLNPSTANETDNDPTIRSVGRIAKANGFGGLYMMNCFPFVSADPKELIPHTPDNIKVNDRWLYLIAEKCACVVFAWGAFDVVSRCDRDAELVRMFPAAKALGINRNGSPKHPLYCKSDTMLIPFIP